MERFVYDRKWRTGLAWAIPIAMFIAVVVFGAPPATILGVIVGELLFLTFLFRRYPDYPDSMRRRR